MAYKLMLRQKNTDYSDIIADDIFIHSETVPNGATSDPLIIPNTVKTIILALIITAGTGRIEASLSSIASIKAGSANWFAWDAGDVSITTDDISERANALRVVNTTGSVIFEAIAY
jgi:hypothetical protein